MGRDRDRGFGNTRAGDDDSSNWRDRPSRDLGSRDDRRDDREAPRERPKLMLKKKGQATVEKKEEKREDDGEDQPRKANPFGAARVRGDEGDSKPAAIAPLKNKSKDVKEDSDEDGFEMVS